MYESSKRRPPGGGSARDLSCAESFEDTLGRVIASGATVTEAIAQGRRLAAPIHVRTEP